MVLHLAATQNPGIQCGTSPGTFRSWCHADCAADPDTHKSTTAFVFTVHAGVFTWLNNRQSAMALSMLEAEYITAATAARKVIWLHTPLHHLGISISTFQIYADNQRLYYYASFRTVVQIISGLQ